MRKSTGMMWAFVLTTVTGHGIAADQAVNERIDLSSGYQILQRSTNENSLSLYREVELNRGEFPTRIIRMEGDISSAGVSCEEVNKTLQEVFTKKIDPNYFLYNTLIGCMVSTETGLAVRFIIDSYFDSRTNEAERYLQSYIREYEGYDLYGIPMHFEEAKGMAISLEISAAQEDSREEHRVLRLSRDYRTLWFNSNYAFMTRFIGDVKERFYSQKTENILPFIKEWFYPTLDKIYADILPRANLVELYPEKIFLMEESPKVFTSRLHFYYKHHCMRYENRKCLV
ncbi:Lpg0189 family type II secretion system effector [Leeuwenhoekiella sp. UBA6783]|uniref:Lpg0189 family type II secretion system effector n=1 Tax=Leeuwenhoekiella sp. UBA6783 TaxID=1946747 RepID=UPI0025BEC5DD|nr:Lpg0189 family type II secretion system effector [Leeuwenhoekiella sp. UBA6783]